VQEYCDGFDVNPEQIVNIQGQVVCILLDIVMPRTNGVDVCVALRKRGFTGRIVAMTANALPQDVNHYLANGFDDVLPKPFTHAMVLSSLNAAAPNDVTVHNVHDVTSPNTVVLNFAPAETSGLLSPFGSPASSSPAFLFPTTTTSS
jgi:CheY-like chemotaxis protein